MGVVFSSIIAQLVLALLFLSSFAASAGAETNSMEARANKQFARAEPSRQFSFPLDHGMHPEFETEWWYFTGHLYREGQTPFKDPAPYGFQLTFFRRATASDNGQQVFLAHAALSSHENPQFRFHKLLTSPLLGLAGAAEDRLRVWNRDWRAERLGDALFLEFSLPKDSSATDPSPPSESLRVSLVVPSVPAPVLQGNAGYSAKSSEVGAASHYYSIPGMRVTGNVASDRMTESVHGLMWMDHEFMTNALTSNQQGWDWFSLSLKDGRHLMLFVLRDKIGGIDYASGTIIHEQQTTLLRAEDFQVQVLDHWESPHSLARYPARWRISVPRMNFSAVLTPRSPAQELHWSSASIGKSAANGNAISYWEGAVSDESQSVIGYAELTGYAGDMGEIL